MTDMRRKIGMVAGIGVLAGASWFIYSNLTQSRRDAAYSAAVASFRRDLPNGTAEVDVRNYLHSRNVTYSPVKIGGRDGETYLVEIGEDPSSLVCDSPKVYAALEFDSADVLQDVHLSKVETCL